MSVACIVINQASTIVCSLHRISSQKYHWRNKEDPCFTNLSLSGNCANLHCTAISRGVAFERAVD
jgi:hypothetical protein